MRWGQATCGGLCLLFSERQDAIRGLSAAGQRFWLMFLKVYPGCPGEKGVQGERLSLKGESGPHSHFLQVTRPENKRRGGKGPRASEGRWLTAWSHQAGDRAPGDSPMLPPRS